MKLKRKFFQYSRPNLNIYSRMNPTIRDLINSKESVKIPDHNRDLKQLLPPKIKKMEKKKTLVLDLDETLVHAKFTEKVEGTPDHSFTIKINNTELPTHLWIRPGAEDFIVEMAKYYELVIFTASRPTYADRAIDIIDPKKLISHRLYRDSWSEHFVTKEDGSNTAFYVKDLSRLSRFIDDIIILDNSPYAYIYQKENGLPIKSWTGEKKDSELFKYINVLKMVAKFEIDLKYTLLNIVKDDLSIDHDKFADIINSAIVKPNYAKKTKDYRHSYFSKSPRKDRFNLGSENSQDDDYFKSCWIQTDFQVKNTDYETDSRRSMDKYDSSAVSNTYFPFANCKSTILDQFEKSSIDESSDEKLFCRYQNKLKLRKFWSDKSKKHMKHL